MICSILLWKHLVRVRSLSIYHIPMEPLTRNDLPNISEFAVGTAATDLVPTANPGMLTVSEIKKAFF